MSVETTAPAATADLDEPPPAKHRRRRGRTVLALTASVAALAAATWVAVGAGGRGGSGANAAAGIDLPPKTEAVRRTTLTDTETADGTLAYGHEWSATCRASGTVTWVPEVGAVIRRGKPLFRVDDDPVVLMYGSVPAYRTLSAGLEGKDVAQFERNLDALGYDGFTVDDEYTSATAYAVQEWQEDRGLAETGRVELGRVVFAAGEVRVAAQQAVAGDAAAPGKAVLTYTGTPRVVTVELEVADQRLAAEKATVRVTLPDGDDVEGKIRSVSTVAEEGTEQQEASTSIEVEVALTKPVEGFDQASVDVEFTASEKKDVLVVPVTALLALAEGGYGVEVVNGSTATVVAVTTGLFADGQVEVSGDGLAEGTLVGVPS